jgi:hypothetical protein
MMRVEGTLLAIARLILQKDTSGVSEKSRQEAIMGLLLIIVILFLLFGGGGYYGYRRQYYGGGGFGLIGVILVVLVVLAIFGGPHMGYKWY